MTTESRTPATTRFWGSVSVALLAWAGAVMGLVWASPRLLASWHGFLHAGIASRFPSATFVPENPFFAGEPVPYYWVYQWIGGAIGRAVGTDPLHAFQSIGLLSLAVLVVVGALTGRRLYQSTAAGLLIGYLALLGMNPMGPAIAGAKHLASGAPLSEHASPDPGGDVFVSDATADDRMAKPLLGAMTFGTDWRGNQNLVWFFDVSSRGPALALLMVMAWLLTSRASGRAPLIALIPAGFLCAALNPVIGLAAAATTVAAAVFVRATGIGGAGGRELPGSLAFLIGALAAWPTFANLLAFGQPLVMTFDKWMFIKAGAIASGFIVIVPLAIWSVVRVRAEIRGSVATLAGSSLLLIAVVPFVELPEANQHNLLNAASCLLAVPAAAWVVGHAGAADRARSGRRAVVLFLIFLPATAGLIWAFAGRATLPIQFDHGALRRTPFDGALDGFYRWAASATQRDAVFITDPRRVVKMSGNVSEIPAFTGRSLFIDHASYLTDPYPDQDVRTTIAERVVTAQPLTAEEVAYLRRFNRPLYAVTWSADEPESIRRLTEQFGAPVFLRDSVAVFRMAAR